MRHASFLGLLAAALLAAPAARAEVNVNTPWVSVHVGRPLPPPELAPTFLPGDPPPVPIDGPAVGVRPPTLEEFAASFHAAPGHYEVVLLHPVTCCPVKVCFTLPGCPCKVRVRAKALVFSYGLCDKVAIRFHHDGTVTVRD